ncbi:MAG: 4-oxalocrotonate tautomerase [Symbiobacterium sp.]|uniref:4-oxalocrotonate tautomerase n=1 Tax=Symbiobacterium sp. TaxID=1971213 RepID=UPI0034640BF8
MPLIRVEMLEGRTPEQKRALIRELTETTARVLDTPKERIRVVLYEVPKTHWGIAGTPVSEIPGR